jgi:hypothetical protein
MPRVEVFPHKAAVVSAKGINFEQVSLTVRNVSVAKDGTSKAGREYHLPPRIQFAEDPSGEDWMWKEWNDTSESFQDYSGVLPVAGDVVQVKLKVSYKGGEDSGEYYRDVHDLYCLWVAQQLLHSPTHRAQQHRRQGEVTYPPLEGSLWMRKSQR